MTVEEKAAVSLQLTEGGEAVGSVDIDNQTTYEIQVNNDGNKQDTFTLTTNGNDWETDFDDSEITIDAFSSQIVIFNNYNRQWRWFWRWW